MKRHMAVLMLALVLVAVVAPAQSPFTPQDVRYFPSGTFSDMRSLDTAIIRWYSKQLTALREPSLWAASKDVRRQSYRFLWLRTWDAPVSIRADVDADGSATLTLKVANGSGGSLDPGELDVVRTKGLTKEEFDAIAENFRSSGFWMMPTNQRTNGRDGARWIVEAVDAGRYHVVDRWTPKEGNIRELALQLLRLSDYKVPEGKLY